MYGDLRAGWQRARVRVAEREQTGQWRVGSSGDLLLEEGLWSGEAEMPSQFLGRTQPWWSRICEFW